MAHQCPLKTQRKEICEFASIAVHCGKKCCPYEYNAIGQWCGPDTCTLLSCFVHLREVSLFKGRGDHLFLTKNCHFFPATDVQFVLYYPMKYVPAMAINVQMTFH